MEELSVTKQMSKFLSRIDKSISTNPTVSTLESLRNALKFNEIVIKPSNLESARPQKTFSPNIEEKSTKLEGKYLAETFSSKSVSPTNTGSTKVLQRPKTPNTPLVQSQKTLNFQPKLNKKSLKIAKTLGNSQDRLFKSNSKNNLPIQEEFSFKPEINKKSNKLASSLKKDHKNRWEILYEHSEEKKKELENNKSCSVSNEKSLEECHFRPQILSPSKNFNTNNTVERLNNWAKARSEKIKEKKDEEIDKDLKECTFMPKIQEMQVSKETLNEIKGVSAYIERGKRKKNEKLEKVQNANVAKDLNKKKYNELIEALHNELQSLNI